MSEPLARIVVPFDIGSTSENRIRCLHWAARAKRFRRARELARLAWLAAGAPVAAGKVRASLIVRRARRLDHFNAAGGCKPVLDGIFIGAMTKDDGPDFLEIGTVHQETDRRYRGAEEVEIVVEAVE